MYPQYYLGVHAVSAVVQSLDILRVLPACDHEILPVLWKLQFLPPKVTCSAISQSWDHLLMFSAKPMDTKLSTRCTDGRNTVCFMLPSMWALLKVFWYSEYSSTSSPNGRNTASTCSTRSTEPRNTWKYREYPQLQ